MNNISKLLSKYALPAMLVILGIILLFSAGSRRKQDSTFIKTEGTIVTIDSTYDAVQEETEYFVTVRFTVDGAERTAVMSDYSSSFKEGKEIPIAYNPDNPSEVIYRGGVSTGLLTGIAVASIVLGAILLVLTFLKILPWTRR